MRKAIIRWGIAWSAVITCLVGIETPGAAADLQADRRRFRIEFETGAIWQGRNEIHIPDSAAGTRFSIGDIQDSTPIVQRRVKATWHPGRRHALRFVYQPLGFSGTGSFASPLLFAGGTFAPGAGWRADRIGRRPLLVLAGLLASVGTGLILLSPDPAVLLLASAVLGLGVGVFLSASWALVTTSSRVPMPGATLACPMPPRQAAAPPPA